VAPDPACLRATHKQAPGAFGVGSDNLRAVDMRSATALQIIRQARRPAQGGSSRTVQFNRKAPARRSALAGGREVRKETPPIQRTAKGKLRDAVRKFSVRQLL